jgi:inner membrane protein
MAWWAWLVTGFALLALEVVTITFGVMFFGISAVVIGLLLWTGVHLEPWLQWLLFSAISVISLALFRRPLMERWQVNQPKKLDTMIGEDAIASEDIPIGGHGKAELRGSTWTARNVGSEPLMRGQRVIVAQVDGIVLHLQSK